MLHIIAAFAAEGHATEQVASHPTAKNTGAPLTGCGLHFGPCAPLNLAIGAFDLYSFALTHHLRDPLVFPLLLDFEKF